MSEKAGTKGAKAAKNSAEQENPAPLADVIVADGQANEPRPAEDPVRAGAEISGLADRRRT
ncbi:TPA: hypothetical protein ACIADK_004275 [Escherichia coli]